MTEQPERMHGMDALRTLVDCRAKLLELRRWSEDLQRLQTSVSGARSTIEWQYQQALQAFEKAVAEAPEELTLQASDGALKWIADAGAEVSRVEAQVREVLQRAEAQP